jgi:phage baseplate assembly protein W
MKTWRIKNGDIVANVKGRIDQVEGTEKIIQDLRGWLLNDLGFNRFHPDMGTVLDYYVGQPITSQLLTNIKETVRNSLNDYMDKQMEEIKLRIDERGDPYIAIGLAEPSSLVRSWTDLKVTHDYTTIHIKISFRTFTDDVDEVVMVISSGTEQSSIA